MKHSMNILLAEDDENISTIIKISLEEIGQHSVEIVSDGEQAVERGSSGFFDLILLDSMMPKKDGLAVCRELTDMGLQTPIIFLSAKSSEKDIENGFASGAVGYIQKPFDPSMICEEIEKILIEKGFSAA